MSNLVPTISFSTSKKDANDHQEVKPTTTSSSGWNRWTVLTEVVFGFALSVCVGAVAIHFYNKE